MSLKIKAGYNVVFKFYYGDLDGYATKIVNLQWERDVQFYVAVAKLFKSGHGKLSDTGMFGNRGCYENSGRGFLDNRTIIEAIKHLPEYNTGLSPSTQDKWREALGDEDGFGEFITDELIGNCGDDIFVWNAFQSATVYKVDRVSEVAWLGATR
jgi:hypothetical protein